ncbi:MAG: ABC transporter ATP-binding protein [Bacteriovoracaceae bacterium]|nr:ABC transporter ATP-binding protein [Bacteriovoracaceae bacterium]
MSLSVESLSKSHFQATKKIQVLNELNLHVTAGESVAIVGKSGSGKSTLLSLLAGLDRPDTGEIKIGGELLNALNETALARMRARKMGIIFQQFQLVQTLSALENVMLPGEILGDQDVSTQALALLKAVGLSERQDHFPNQLSGGEQQRVAIARALAGKPEVLLADEPTGNLDVETGANVMDLLFSLAKEKGTSLILVTHDPEIAKRCDRILKLEKGQLSA